MWYYFLFSDKSILADFFFKWDKEKSAKLCELEILKILSQLNGAAQDLFKLKMKKRLHFLKVHQKLTKQSDLIFLIFCIFHLVLDTFFWTCIKCSDWDCAKTSQPRRRSDSCAVYLGRHVGFTSIFNYGDLKWLVYLQNCGSNCPDLRQ